jgi:hypothetical protein
MPRHHVSRPTQATPYIPDTAIAVLAAAALRLLHARDGSLSHADSPPLGVEESTYVGISVLTASQSRSSVITGGRERRLVNGKVEERRCGARSIHVPLSPRFCDSMAFASHPGQTSGRSQPDFMTAVCRVRQRHPSIIARLACSAWWPVTA